MIRRLTLTLGLFLLLICLTAISPAAHAQGGPDIFVTPIPNVPFSAEFKWSAL